MMANNPCKHPTFFLVAVLLLAISSQGDGRIRRLREGLEEQQRDTTDAASLGLWLETTPQQATDNSLAAAMLQYVPLFCIDSLRCAKLDMSRKFSFIHISKTGGTSWIQEFKILLNNFFP
jgi:hypothetical protein